MNQVELTPAPQSAIHMSGQSAVDDHAPFPGTEVEMLAGPETPQANESDCQQKTRASALHLVHRSANRPASVRVVASWDQSLPNDLRQLVIQADKRSHVCLTSDAIRSLVLRIAIAEAATAEELDPVSCTRGPFLFFSREQMGFIVDGLIAIRGNLLERIPASKRSTIHVSVEQVTSLLSTIARFFGGCKDTG